MEPTEGFVNRNSKIRVAKFSQHHVDHLNLHQTPLEFLSSKFQKADSSDLRGCLSALGITGDLQLQPIYQLSGGQKSRIVFATMSYLKPHALLLDEPSSFLDVDTVDALIQALLIYQGGIVLVSHDQYLIESLGAEIWVCDSQSIQKFDGSFAQYKKQLDLNF